MHEIGLPDTRQELSQLVGCVAIGYVSMSRVWGVPRTFIDTAVGYRGLAVSEYEAVTW